MIRLEIAEDRKRILQIALSEYIGNMLDYAKKGADEGDCSAYKPCQNAAEIADGILKELDCDLLPQGWERW